MKNMALGAMISDKSSLLRSFKLAKNGRIILLVSMLGYADATLAQLETGLDGTGDGWDYPDRSFWATISDVTGEVLELKQNYRV